MSDWLLNYFSGWAAIAVLFVLIILTANFELKDLDLWLHLATGRHILHTFQIPALSTKKFAAL